MALKSEEEAETRTVLGRVVTLADLGVPAELEVAEAWVREHLYVGEGAASSKVKAEPVAVVGLDCEWQAPWFRGDTPERVCTLQLATVSAVLLARVRMVQRLPPLLTAALQDAAILKVGVNINGDGERLRRDLKVRSRGLHELSRRGSSSSSEASLQGLAWQVLGVEMDKDKGISCSDWGQWPLSDRQVEYACMDAAVAVDIYYKGGPELRERCEEDEEKEWPEEEEEEEEEEECGGKENVVPAPAADQSSSKPPSDFFLMMRNKSIVPPNKGRKTYPQGRPDVLDGCVFVISGVLDSFDRSECTAYIARHGGLVRSSITRATTHLLHDHGEVGPKKIKEAKRMGIPVIGEDVLLGMVAQGTPCQQEAEVGRPKQQSKKPKAPPRSSHGKRATKKRRTSR